MKRPIVAIHQPNYLPWLGFFDKMKKADILILLDNVQFSKGSRTNRVQIRTDRGPLWLTVPVYLRGRFGCPIAEVEIDHRSSWRKKHIRTLELNYGKAPFYSAISEEVYPVLQHPFNRLRELNLSVIERMAKLLSIDTETVLGSELGVAGRGTQLLVDMVRTIGGRTYLSGDGAGGYQENSLYERNGIELVFQNFRHPVYRQFDSEFVPGMSIFDFLCHQGVEVVADFLKSSSRSAFL